MQSRRAQHTRPTHPRSLRTRFTRIRVHVITLRRQILRRPLRENDPWTCFAIPLWPRSLRLQGFSSRCSSTRLQKPRKRTRVQGDQRRTHHGSRCPAICTGRVQILLDGQPVESVALAVIAFKNTGTTPIPAAGLPFAAFRDLWERPTARGRTHALRDRVPRTDTWQRGGHPADAHKSGGRIYATGSTAWSTRWNFGGRSHRGCQPRDRLESINP